MKDLAGQRTKTMSQQRFAGNIRNFVAIRLPSSILVVANLAAKRLVKAILASERFWFLTDKFFDDNTPPVLTVFAHIVKERTR